MNDNSSVKTISLKVPGPPLRIIREILGLSQSEVAGLVRISQAAISLYESGRRSPSGETRRRLAVALDVSPEILFPRPGDE